MDSKRQQIVDRLVERMQQIETRNGYRTNIGRKVFDWEIHLQQEDIDNDGAVSICDMPAEAAVPTGRSDPRETIWKMPVQIRCFFGKDTQPRTVRQAIADINDVLRQDDRIKNENNVGLAMITRPLREGIFKPEDSYEVIGGIVELEVQYITAKFNSQE